MCGGCNQSSVTNTPNPTASAAYNDVISKAQTTAATPYQPYTGELTAGLNRGQTRAIGQLEGAAATGQPFYQAGATNLANASGGLGNVQNYLQAGSQATAGTQAYQAAAANQYAQGNTLALMGSTANQQVGQYLGQANDAYGQMTNGLGQVGNYLNAANGYFGQAAGLATPQDFTGADGVSKYENPYTQDVINTTMAQARQNDAAQTASLVGNAIGNGAYGGDRNGIAVGTIAGQQAMANNSTVAGLNQANYAQATQQFNATQAQRQAGAGIYTNLGQGELQAGNTQLQTAMGYGQAGSGYAGLGQLQGQVAAQYGNLGQISNAVGAGYNSLGQTNLATAAQYGNLGTIQGTTGQAYGTLGSLYGNLGTQAQSGAVSGASAGLQGATLQQQTQQAQDTAAYQQFQNSIQYPFNTTGYLSNIVQGIGSASGGTQTTAGNALSGIAGAATSGLGVLGVTGAFGANGYLTGANGLLSASDERVKENIEPIGRTFDGQTIHRYNYKGDDPRDVKTGLIAQEVAGRDLGAVGHMGGGVMGVDYDRATRGAADRGHFARGGGLGNLSRMMAGSDQIRLPGGLGGIRAPGGLGSIRPHFDDGGTVGNDYLASSDFAQDLARNPLVTFRAPSGGNSSGLPGGNLSRMPTASAADPSSSSSSGGNGLGALSANPGASGGLSTPPAVSFNGDSSGSGTGSSGGTAGASPDTFGAGNQNLWLSLISGGAGALGGKSASGLANIGAGLQSGIQTYMGLKQQDVSNARAQAELSMKQRQSQIDQQRADDEATFHKGSLANATAETGIRQQDLGIRQQNATSENASRDQSTAIGRYSTSFVPGVGYVTRDLTNPTAPPRVSPLNPSAGAAAAPSAASAGASGPVSFGGPGDPGSASAAPAPSPAAPRYQPPVTQAASSPAAPAASAPTSAPSSTGPWKPSTTVPDNYVPPNQMAIYQNPGLLKGEQENAAKAIGESRDQAGAGQQLQMRLDEMDRQFAQLPKNGLLSPGAAATARGDIAKGINTFATTLGAAAPYDPNQVAANENLLKDRFRLGADLAKQMGGREPGYIVEQAVKANPGADNTPLAYQRITAGLRQAAQYQQDKAAFFDDYNAKFGHLNGAQQAFDQMNPPQRYADRAVVSTVDPRDLGVLQANANNPAALSKFDQLYGTGTASTVLRSASASR